MSEPLMTRVRAIPLTQGKFAIIDENDYELVAPYTWCALKGRYTWYAMTSIPHPDGGYRSDGYKRYTLLGMHTLITGYQITDHKNRDGLDKRRANLRPATTAQNGANSRRHSNNTSGHVGVFWHRVAGKWMARVGVQGSKRHLGYYISIDDAIAAYHAAAHDLFGEFAPDCCETAPWQVALLTNSVALPSITTGLPERKELN